MKSKVKNKKINKFFFIQLKNPPILANKLTQGEAITDYHEVGRFISNVGPSLL